MASEYAEELAKAQRRNYEYIELQMALGAYYDFVAERWRNGQAKIIPLPSKEETPSE